MKAILKFDLPFDQEEYNDAVKGTQYKLMLDRIANEVFRPHRKHGYSDKRLQELIDTSENAEEIIEILENMFYEILNDRD